MATKSKFGEDGGVKLKLVKPVISTDVMGNRNVEVRAVGAWVQPESEISAYRAQEAVLSARQEENRLHQKQRQKEEKLRRFQDEVRRRVNAMQRVKKQQLVDKSVKQVECERNVVSQSAFPRGNTASRKDHCSYHHQTDLSFHSPNTSLSHKQSNLVAEDGINDQGFAEQNNQTRAFVKQARKNLVSRRVITDDYIEHDLPGGVWKVSATRDHPATRNMADSNVIETEGTDDKENDVCYAYTSVNDICDDMEQLVLRVDPGVKTVQFDLQPQSQQKTRQERIKHRSATTIDGGQVMRNVPHVSVPEIYTGVLSEEEKRRKQCQHAMYRRLFMDIEREQVKENIRRKEHRKRIARLKQEKEELRRVEEQQAQQLVEARDPVTGETREEATVRDHQEQSYMEDTIKLHQAKAQKAKELERYLDALKYRLRGKIKQQGVELPPLCCCGETIWDTNPDTCANNCVFYKNPKGYAKALQSLLSSQEVM